MNLLFLGDVNSNIKKVNDFLEKRPYIDQVFQTGNLGFSKSSAFLKRNKISKDQVVPIRKGQELVFCKGVNDDYSHIGSMLERRHNIFRLENGEIFQKGNIKIAVLGGIFVKERFGEKRNKKVIDKYIRKEDVDTLKKHKVDILLTHMGPKGYVPTGWGSHIIFELMDYLQPKFLIHGHHKINYKAKHKDTEVIGLGDFSTFDKSYKILNI